MTVVLKYVLVLLLGYVKGTQGSCADLSSIDQTKVATMCHNSTVQGTMVFIDTGAMSTTTLDQGVACTCQVDVQTGKQVDGNVYYSQVANCGTMLKFTHNTNTFEVACGNYAHNFPTSQFTNITVDLLKSRADGIVDYCTYFLLQYCPADQFQCDNLTCIDRGLVCDGVGDCNDDSDEANCNPVSCNEGLVRCGDRCILSTEICNDPGTGSGNAGTQLPPLITITCEESPYLPQATTTAAPTTNPPTTTTSTVATAPSPNTTTTTASVLTPSTTQTPLTTSVTTPSITKAPPTASVTTPSTTKTSPNSSSTATPSSTKAPSTSSVTTSTVKPTTSPSPTEPTTTKTPSSVSSRQSTMSPGPSTSQTTAKQKGGDDDDDDDDDTKDIIITVVITGILLLLLIILAIYCFIIKPRRNEENGEDNEAYKMNDQDEPMENNHL